MVECQCHRQEFFRIGLGLIAQTTITRIYEKWGGGFPQVEMRETEVVRDQLQREGIEIISGTARFLESGEGEPHRVMVLRTSEKTEAKTR